MASAAPSPAALHVQEGTQLAHYLSSGKKKNDRWYWLTPSGAQGRVSVSWAKKNKGRGKGNFYVVAADSSLYVISTDVAEALQETFQIMLNVSEGAVVPDTGAGVPACGRCSRPCPSFASS